jgi:hypothetical protein
MFQLLDTGVVLGEGPVLGVLHVTPVLILEVVVEQKIHQAPILAPKTRRAQRVVAATVETLEDMARTGTDMARHRFIHNECQSRCVCYRRHTERFSA